MRRLFWRSFVAITASVVAMCPMTQANATDSIRQYKAAVTNIFLRQYRAMPIYRTNPLYPGDVIRIENESIAVRGCYPKQINGNYIATQSFLTGLAVGGGADAEIDGILFSRRLASLKASGRVTFSEELWLTVSPLAVDRADPDLAALNDWDRSQKKCQVVGDLLQGRKNGLFLIAEVLHGIVNFRSEATVSGGVDLGAEIEATKAFPLTQVKIGGGASTNSLTVFSSPAPMTVAVIPAYYNLSELARITNFMRGERGKQLEIAVQEALTARDLSEFQKFMFSVREYLGEEFERQNRWAEDVVGGEERFIATSSDIPQEDFAALATYGAAMVIAQK